jgi:hypothetical protein
VCCFLLHLLIDFLRPEQLLVVRKRAAHPLTYRVRLFALEREKVGQKASTRSSIGFPREAACEPRRADYRVSKGTLQKSLRWIASEIAWVVDREHVLAISGNDHNAVRTRIRSTSDVIGWRDVTEESTAANKPAADTAATDKTAADKIGSDKSAGDASTQGP